MTQDFSGTFWVLLLNSGFMVSFLTRFITIDIKFHNSFNLTFRIVCCNVNRQTFHEKNDKSMSGVHEQFYF